MKPIAIGFPPASSNHNSPCRTGHVNPRVVSNTFRITSSFLFPLALIVRLKDKIFPPVKIDGLSLPNHVINHFFEKIFSLETFILGKFSFPFGLSIIVVAEKE